MTTTEQLEREAEETRARISATLDELRGHMTPGHVVDQLVDYANDSSAGAFFRNLREQVVANPMPIALMGAGMAWLAFSNRRSTHANSGTPTSTRHVTGGASEKLDEWRDQSASAASNVRERARDIASNLQDTSGKATGWVSETAGSAYEAAAERANEAGSRLRSGAKSVADATSATYEATADQARRAGEKLQSAASHMRGNVASSSRTVMNFLNEQPLVLVGIGLALGAVMGGALPSTDAEDELMGESSDTLKQETAAVVEEKFEQGKAVAEEAWQGAQDQTATATADQPDSDPALAHAGATQRVENGQAPLVPSSAEATDREVERSGS